MVLVLEFNIVSRVSEMWFKHSLLRFLVDNKNKPLTILNHLNSE